jgi:hypothetical protein
VFKLKRIYGLDIETITEMHGGDYAGKHARYVLRSCVALQIPRMLLAMGVPNGGDDTIGARATPTLSCSLRQRCRA